MNDSYFDAYASDYDQALQSGLSVSGESSEFFARSRLSWLRRRLDEFGTSVDSVLDFGCGVGAATDHFISELGVQRYLGIDPSVSSISLAQENLASRDLGKNHRIDYQNTADYDPDEQFDLVFCNGVFHHIALEARSDAIKTIFRSIRPGGVFAFWENNPYSIPARYVMSRIPFDRDAIMVWPRQARKQMRDVGFDVLLTDYCFLFPAMMSWLRWSEGFVRHVPLGAQYLILSKKR